VDRRRFLLTSLAGALAAPLAAGAQQAGKIYRVGLIGVDAAEAAGHIALREGLRTLGYEEGPVVQVRGEECVLLALNLVAEGTRRRTPT
jgi:hypothetical protein